MDDTRNTVPSVLNDYSAPAREALDASSWVPALARHLAFSPVAFGVTDGPGHVLRYANAAFRQLLSSGAITIGPQPAGAEGPAADLAPLFDRAFRRAETVRDEVLPSSNSTAGRWSCTVWPILSDASVPEGLVMEVRDAAYLEGAIARQRSIAERLLLGALREQDAAREALQASDRAAFLATATRDLALSLDEDAIRAIVQRRALQRDGTWCIVDVVESNGALRRLAVVHPDPAKQTLAHSLADDWHPERDDPIGAPSIARSGPGAPVVITQEAGSALVAAAHGPENLEILRRLGFGALLVVPLVFRDRVLGAITFVSPEHDPTFSPSDISLASELADRCAMALDNARLYREADVLRETADAANKAKSKFLGVVSHELRAPLNVIGGYLELLEMELRGPVTPEQRVDLARIKLSQQHLITLIAEILTFVRTESGRMEYHFAEVSVQAALDDVAHMLDGAIRERGLTLVRPEGSGDIMVWADPDRVRQILINLVTNAVKYNVAGEGKIGLGFTASPDSVFILVTDTGPGIPSGQADAIFEPFVQLAGGLSDRKGGVGLGLAISRDLARAMNGDLTVTSAVGAGSQFTLDLPRAGGEPQPL